MITPSIEIQALNTRLDRLHSDRQTVTLAIDRMPLFRVGDLDPLVIDSESRNSIRRLHETLAVRRLLLFNNPILDVSEPVAVVRARDAGLYGVPITPDQINAVGAVLSDQVNYDFYGPHIQGRGGEVVYRVPELISSEEV